MCRNRDVGKQKNCWQNACILRVNDFDKIATTPLDEWIEFLKTGKIDEKTHGAGLAEGRETGRAEWSSEIAKQLKTLGVQGAQILQATGLPESDLWNV